MRSKRSDNGESEVLGEILLVALVAIVACSVGASAFSMAGTVTNSKSVAITAEAKSSGVLFTVQGGMDLNSVNSIDLIADGVTLTCISGTPKVGDTCQIGTDLQGRTVMIAKFADGSSQVIFDKNWGTLLSQSASRYGTATSTWDSPTEFNTSFYRGPLADQVISATVFLNYTHSDPWTGEVVGYLPDADYYVFPINPADPLKRFLVTAKVPGGTVVIHDETIV